MDSNLFRLSKRAYHVCVELQKSGGPLWRFFIMSETKLKWKRLLYSERLVDKNTAHKIAYVGVVTAFLVVGNLFFEFKLADTQFSFTLALSALAGMLIGPLFGFVACFLGDLVGFLFHNAGMLYMPWIGISMGLVAFFAGLLIGNEGRKGNLLIRIAFLSLTTFLVCTVGINTTAFWLLYAKTDYMTYLISRLFLQGQIWNSLVNYVLLFILIPLLKRRKM